MPYPELSKPCPPCYRSPEENFRVINGFSTEGEMLSRAVSPSGLLARPCFFQHKYIGNKEITVIEGGKPVKTTAHMWKISSERSDAKAVKDAIGRGGMEVQEKDLNAILDRLYNIRDAAESKK